MRKYLFKLPFFFLAISSVSFADEKPLWFQFSDQLVLKFHLSSMKRFPATDDLVHELNNPSPDFKPLIDSYKRERDAFKKKELSDAIANKMYNTALPEGSSQIAFFSRVYLGEYSFEKNGFDLCFNKDCNSRPDKLTEKFGAKKYSLLVSNVGTSYFFAPGEATSKKLESLASKGSGWNYRAMPAVIVVEPTATDDSQKWSDGTSYNVLKTNLVGVYLLNDGKFNRRAFPEEGEIAAYVEYKQ